MSNIALNIQLIVASVIFYATEKEHTKVYGINRV